LNVVVAVFVVVVVDVVVFVVVGMEIHWSRRTFVFL